MPGSENRENLGVEDAWKYLEERFGIEKGELGNYKIIKKSGDFWLTSKENEPDLEYETVGIRFLRDTGKYIKPTTYGLQILGDKINTAEITVSKEELITLLDGNIIERELGIEKGYVAINYQGRVVGCGLYKDELVSSRISKGRAQELKNLI